MCVVRAHRDFLQAHGSKSSTDIAQHEKDATLEDNWFTTGDVATIDRYGHFQITDRSKDVIKSGGEWVSSIEIEGVIMSHPAVRLLVAWEFCMHTPLNLHTLLS